MPKNIAEEKLKEKLTYLDLNLEKIPSLFKEFTGVQFQPSKSYDETSEKVYRYLKVSDIQILLTPTERLKALGEKYKQAKPLSLFLNSKSEEHIEEFARLFKNAKRGFSFKNKAN